MRACVLARVYLAQLQKQLGVVFREVVPKGSRK
jgi:hypothetical protein